MQPNPCSKCGDMPTVSRSAFSYSTLIQCSCGISRAHLLSHAVMAWNAQHPAAPTFPPTHPLLPCHSGMITNDDDTVPNAVVDDICTECNGRGHFLFPFSTPQCEPCCGTGKRQSSAHAPRAAYWFEGEVVARHPNGFVELKIWAAYSNDVPGRVGAVPADFHGLVPVAGQRYRFEFEGPLPSKVIRCTRLV